MNGPRVEPLRPVITTEQIQKRVKELGRQISDDYKGQTIQILAVLENAFMFLADLVRAVKALHEEFFSELDPQVFEV